jgi:aspartyl-tRNA(Asn)/glutamyl-tRNA(Gln) amidotransferase subunit C
MPGLAARAKWPNTLAMEPTAPPGAARAVVTLTRADVEHVAKLASLSLTPDEADAFTAELAAILRHVGELDALDTTAIAPTLGGGVLAAGAGAWRADQVVHGLAHEEALAAAPRTVEGGFAVPAFVDPHAPGAR